MPFAPGGSEIAVNGVGTFPRPKTFIGVRIAFLGTKRANDKTILAFLLEGEQLDSFGQSNARRGKSRLLLFSDVLCAGIFKTLPLLFSICHQKTPSNKKGSGKIPD